MVMSVNTNISSLNAQKNLATSQSKLATAISRLSSGMRINSAKDDAAGLAISTRFTTQINGLNQAVSNANDGISLAQTTESALNEVTNNMQRIRTLAVQSANATNSDSDRAALDAEVQQRLSEITRISQQTTFNGRHVLDGTFGNAAFQIGANVGETISVNLSQGAGASQVGQIATSKTGDISSKFASPAGLTLAAGDLTVQVGAGGVVNVAAGSYTTLQGLADAINTAIGGGSTIASVSGNELAFDNSTASAVTFGGSAATSLNMTSVAAATTSVAPQTTTTSGLSGFSSFNALKISAFTITDGTNTANVTGTFADQASFMAAINAAATANSMATVVAADDGAGAIKITNGTAGTITISGADAQALGLDNGGVAIAASGTVTESDTFANDLANDTGSLGVYSLGAGDLTIGSTAITGDFRDATSLAALISGITGLTATANGGEIDFVNSTASDIAITDGTSGSDLSFLGTKIDKGTSSTTNGTAGSTGAGTAVTAAAGTDLVLGSGDLTIGGVDMAGTYKSAQNLVDAINAKGIAGVAAYYDSDAKSVHLNSQSALVVDGAKAGSSGLGFSNAGSTAIAVGSNLAASDVKSVAGANDTISRIDAALNTISSMRSDLGAVQNRFDSTIANLQTISQNLSASRSQIQDADFAAETANMSSANILQQAGVSVLAQANATTQSVLKLLQ